MTQDLVGGHVERQTEAQGGTHAALPALHRCNNSIGDTMFSKTFSALAILSAFVLSACETVEGAGRDIESAGEAVTDAAQDAQ